MSNPIDTPPPQRQNDDDAPPRWVRVWLPPTGRVATFVIGAVMALRESASEAQIVGGSGLMLASAGFAAMTWFGQRKG